MRQYGRPSHKIAWTTFFLVFLISMGLGLNMGTSGNVQAAPDNDVPAQSISDYKGAASCAGCHKEIHENWVGTRHSQAYSSPIFQEDWVKQGSSVACLACHTTGFDAATGTYAEQGITCEACHGPLVAEHPRNPMSVTPDSALCATCHKTTTDEWQASKHGQLSIDCQTCHDPHAQTPRAGSVNELCANCHKDTGSSFTHGTHANSGLQCSDCHMSASQAISMVGGLFATGHTFSVGSEACINCHRDTVHTRDTITRLSGSEASVAAATLDELRKKTQEDAQTIQALESQATVRLYTGLIQGAIVGVITGGAAAWVVSKRIRYVDVDDEKESDEEKSEGK